MKLLLLAFPIFLLSCNDNSDDASRSDTTGQSRPYPIEESRDEYSATGCYMRVVGRDTLVVRLEQHGDSVNGRIYFDNYQKDGSFGTATGNVSRDTVHLHYSFQSEGTSSVMEMYFQLKDGSLIRGTGEMGVRNDTAYFTSPATIVFPGNERLEKVPCTGLHLKYSD
jgi:hypothetical protein